MADMGVVDEQILAFPLELDVGVFALIVGKPTSLNRRFVASLFQVGNRGFHETHAIHHPIQILDVLDDGLRRAYARCHFPTASIGFGIGDLPGRRHDVAVFVDQLVQIHAGIR